MFGMMSLNGNAQVTTSGFSQWSVMPWEIGLELLEMTVVMEARLLAAVMRRIMFLSELGH